MSAPTQFPPSRSRREWALGGLALLAVAALAVVLLATGAFARRTRTTVVTRTVSAPAATALNAAAIYAAANPGVVDITAHSTVSTPFGPFGLPRQAQSTDTGTGMVVDGKGDVLTADHVVAGANSITVTFPNGATRKAKVLGGDAATDVAVLHVNPSGLTLHPLTLGSLNGHRVGDPVAVIGDPFDVQRSLSTGVISGLDRTISALNGYEIPHALQTDAAMNPGNSGGPVLDASGQVIGIADQIATGESGSESSTGVGFAVPVDIVRSELSQLEAGVTPAHADLGVAATDATDANGSTGALVGAVSPGGAAAKAGVRVGDTVVALGSTRIDSTNALVAALSAGRPGEHTTVTVVRGGRRLTLNVTLAKEPTAATS
ncbi:MAG TPA: trypsin-like peptidase domain-containing protein [Solirubrobacter sp.]|nr:trypsin-like peptidase domain-containing protein [Solirubrobacter sp.]